MTRWVTISKITNVNVARHALAMRSPCARHALAMRPLCACHSPRCARHALAMCSPCACHATLLKVLHRTQLFLQLMYRQTNDRHVAIEIEFPYGDDKNDLPIQQLQENMNIGLRVLLDRFAHNPPKFHSVVVENPENGMCECITIAALATACGNKEASNLRLSYILQAGASFRPDRETPQPSKAKKRGKKFKKQEPQYLTEGSPDADSRPNGKDGPKWRKREAGGQPESSKHIMNDQNRSQQWSGNLTRHSTTEHNTIQYNTARHTTTHHDTSQHITTPYNTIQYDTPQYGSSNMLRLLLVGVSSTSKSKTKSMNSYCF